jgi:RHS repeat-associated protein
MTLGYSAMPNGLLNRTTIQTLIENITTSLFGEVTNRNVKKGTATLFAEDLIRDNLGRITQRVMTITGWPTVTYNYFYDDRGRLTEVRDSGLNWIRRYTYDDNGNRLTFETASPLSTVTSTTNSQDQLTSSGVYTYTYNLNGELQTKTNTFLNQTTTYTYDDFGNLTQVVLENGDVIAYEIDGLNRRVGKKKNNVLIERYLWNEDQLIAELNPNNTIKRRYIYVTKSHVPDYYVEGTTNYKIVTDSLGSPVLVLKACDGAVTQRIEYDEFGRVLQDSRSGELVIGYAGGVSDWDTKLVRFGARDYDPATGRWLSKDPILFEGGDANLYGYVESDPVNWIDPQGMSKLGDKLMNRGPDGAPSYTYPTGGTNWNPFQNRTSSQIDSMFKKKGFQPVGPDPVNGIGGYVNPKTGRSYHIDRNNRFGESPHVDVNRVINTKIKKRKFDMCGDE